MVLLGSLDAATHTTPAHHRSVRRQTAFQRLVPSDDVTATALHILLHAINHIALQILLRRVFAVTLDAQCLDTSLALRAALPTHLRALVATHMDIFRREEVDDLAQHILQELQRLVVTGTDYIVRNTPFCPYLIRATRTT